MAEAQPTSHVAVSVLVAILLTAVTTTATPHQSPDPAVQVGQVADGAREDGVIRRGIEMHHHTVNSNQAAEQTREDGVIRRGIEMHHHTVDSNQAAEQTTEDGEGQPGLQRRERRHYHALESNQAADVAIEDDVRRGAESHHTTTKSLPEPQRGEVEALKKTFNCSGHTYMKVRAFVEIRTDSRHLAGTDADVQVRVEGPKGIGAMNLMDDPNADDFESGSQKYYGVCLHDLGDKIIKVHVRVTERGQDPDWFLDWIRVYYKGECYKFVFWRWMDSYLQWYVEDNPIYCF